MYIDKFKNKGYIFLEDPKTWPKDWISLIEKNRELIINYLDEDAAILEERNKLKESGRESENKYDVENSFSKKIGRFTKTFKALILSTNQQILCYHATRLMDYEVELIKQNGLKKCSLELRKEKIDNLLEYNIINKYEYEILSNKENNPLVLRPKRLNNTDLIWGYNTFDINDYEDCAYFLNDYGGEMIDQASFSNELKVKLQKASKPYIIICIDKISLFAVKSNKSENEYFENIIKPYINNDEIKFLNFQLKNIDSLPIYDVVKYDLWNE